MKSYILSFAIIVTCHFAVSAQSGSPVKKIKLFGTPNSWAVVLDSAGKTLPYDDWHSKLITGEYKLVDRRLTDADTALVLRKLSQREVALLLARMPPPATGPFKNDEQSLEPFFASDINKFKIKSSDWAGKIIVLNFWFIDCPPCRQEIPELNKIVTKYANDQNIIFIGICLDSKSHIEKFIKDKPFAYHLIPDGRYITDALGIHQYPLNMVIDKQGTIRLNTVGYGPHWEKFIDDAIIKYKDL